MIETFYQLTIELLKSYVTETYESEITVKVDTPEYSKWETDSFTVTVSELSANKTLVNFIKGSDSTSVTVQWDEWDFKVPVENVSYSLKQQFTLYMDSKMNPPGPKSAEEKHVQTESEQHVESKRWAPALASESGKQGKPADMPDFDDEYEVLGSSNRQSNRSQPSFAPIGDRDLNPPGLPRDPLMKPYIDPLAAPDGGMHPSMDHPLFGSRQGNSSRRGVPPGARFDDPYGEDNLEDMGMGLPGNLRQGGLGGPGGSGFGSGFGPGGSSGFGGGNNSFGGGFGF